MRAVNIKYDDRRVTNCAIGVFTFIAVVARIVESLQDLASLFSILHQSATIALRIAFSTAAVFLAAVAASHKESSPVSRAASFSTYLDDAVG